MSTCARCGASDPRLALVAVCPRCGAPMPSAVVSPAGPTPTPGTRPGHSTVVGPPAAPPSGRLQRPATGMLAVPPAAAPGVLQSGVAARASGRMALGAGAETPGVPPAPGATPGVPQSAVAARASGRMPLGAGAAETPGPPSGRLPAPGGGLSPDVLAAIADPARCMGALAADVVRSRGLPAGAGRYALLGELGRGGMGVVYRAFDVGLRRPVAIKMVLDTAGAGPTRVERFLREASATARLRHPHIVAVHEAGEHQGKPFIVMDLVDGESLEALLERESGLPPRRAAEVVEQVARALEHAHEAGVVHRDVKPQNIMIDRAGGAHLMDFGLARDMTEGHQLTREGQLVGTPHFMAPEQAAGDSKRQGPATDVWALGGVLYRILCGRPPFEADSLIQLSQLILFGDPEPPRMVNPDVHPDLETIALRCLEKEPEARYASAGDLAEDLRRFGAGEPILARPATLADQARRALRRHRAVVIAGAVVAVAMLLTVGGALAYRASERRGALRAALAAGRDVRERFDEVAQARPPRYAEAHALALQALAHLDHALNVDPASEPARRAKFELAVRMGELALAERDYGLATTMFSAASGLAVDVEAATARMRAVDEARGQDERRIREGVEQLLQELEGKEGPAAPGHGLHRRRVLEVGTELAALSGGRRSGRDVLLDACRAALLDRARAPAARVACGLVLASLPDRDPALLEPLARGLDAAGVAEDPVGAVVCAHVLASTADERFAAPLRAAREPFARRMRDGGAALSPEEQDLTAELGRALLIHGDPGGARAVLEELLARGWGTFGSSPEDFEGTLSARTAGAWAEVLRRGSPIHRLVLLLGLDQSDELDLARLEGPLVELILEGRDEDHLPFAHGVLEVPFPFDALHAGVLLESADERRASSSAWQAVRMLVRADRPDALVRASAAKDDWARGIVALGMGEVSPGPAVQGRLTALREDGSPWVRACATVALARALDPAALAAIDRAPDDPHLRSLTGAARELAGLEPGAPALEVWTALEETQPVALGRLVLASGAVGQRGAPVTGLAEPTVTRASTGTNGEVQFTRRGALPPSVALLGRTGRFVRASSLRSPVAHAALEAALRGAPRGSRRAQGALRLLALLGHPGAAALAKAQLGEPGASPFLEVEVLRALIVSRDPGASAVLRDLRLRWGDDPLRARALEAETRIRTNIAVISAAGLFQQSLASCLQALASSPTPAALRELAHWTGRWTCEVFAALDATGEPGLAMLDHPTTPPGAAAYLEAWWALERASPRDPARARRALERAVADGFGTPRAQLLLGWLALQAGEAERAHASFVAARRAGSPVARQATLWQGWVAMQHLHRPLEAEACWRSLILEQGATGLPVSPVALPPPAGELPTLPSIGPLDAPAGPWPIVPVAEGAPTTPFVEGAEEGIARALLGHHLAVERGEVARGWELATKAWSDRFDDRFRRLLPLLAEMALRAGSADALAWVHGQAALRAPTDPAWPAWQGTQALDGARGLEAALRAVAPFTAREDAAGAAACTIAALLQGSRGDAAGARRTLDVLLARDPLAPLARRDASLLAAQQGDLEAALEHARVAARVDPWLVVAAGVDARAHVLDLVGRLVNAPPPADSAALARRVALLREVVPALPAEPDGWPAAWEATQRDARWDANAGVLR